MKFLIQTNCIAAISCFVAIIGNNVWAQTAAGERGCLDAVERQARDARHVRLIESHFSQAATEYILEADGERWSCVAWDNGEVVNLERTRGGSSHNRTDYDRRDYDERNDGVTLFEHEDYRGQSEIIYDDVRSMGHTRIGNDALSSIRVPRDCRVVLYEHEDFRGRSFQLESDESQLDHTRVGNDEVSSIEVNCGGEQRRGEVVLYSDSDFRGASQVIYEDVPEMDRTRVGNDELSSIEVPRGCWVVLYEHENYRGRSEEFESDERDLHRTDIGNDEVSSVRVDCR